MSDYRTWTTCPDCGKRRYPTRAEARKAMRAIRSRDGRLHAYRCPVGNDWHLGHLPIVNPSLGYALAVLRETHDGPRAEQ